MNPRLMSFLIRIALAFEPLAPTAISYYLSRSLRDLEQQGLISNYRAHTKRLGKFHYKVEIDAELTSNQAHYILAHILPKRLKVLGRWFNV
jgi:hypothetical protein